jgi:predicted nucleic acid-binding protein
LRGWLLDTNVLSELRAGRYSNPVRTWVYSKPRDSVYISVLSLAEFEKGLYALAPDDPDRIRIASDRQALENYFRSFVLPVSDSVVLRWGQICGDAKRIRSIRLDPIDAMFAATALEHDLVLVTRNVRDMVNTGATIFDPFALA